MQIKKYTVRQITDALIIDLYNAKNQTQREKIYKNFETDIKEFGLNPAETQKIIKYNFYNFDLLAEFLEPQSMSEYLYYLALKDTEQNTLKETIYNICATANTQRKNKE